MDLGKHPEREKRKCHSYSTEKFGLGPDDLSKIPITYALAGHREIE